MLLFLASVSAAEPFDTSSADSPVSTAADIAAADRGGFVAVPIPFSDPAIGPGLAVMAGYLYALDKEDSETPESLTGIGGFWADSGSRGAAILQKLFLGKDRYRISMGFGATEFHTEFFGIGNQAGEQGRSVPLTQKADAAFAQLLVRTRGELFVGATVGYAELDTRTSIDLTAAHGVELNQSTRLISYAANLVGDWRDESYYPTSGSLLEIDASYRDRAGFRNTTYWKYTAAYNHYMQLSSASVLALRASGCYVDGQAPFYDLCLFGKNSDLRGYSVGRFRDRGQLAAQAEYRMQLTERWGAAVFAGVGGVAQSMSDFSGSDLLASYGAGLRFRVQDNPRINLRVDYARSGQEEALHISVGEAF